MKRFRAGPTRIISGFLTLLAVALTLASAAQAQTEQRNNPTNIQLQSCHQVCFTGGESCTRQKGGTLPFCDTLEIGCVVSCDACINVFSSCMKTGDQTQRFCQNTFDDCLDSKLTASRARARPQIIFKGGNGLSQAGAVVIEGVTGSSEGAQAENLWIVRAHPDWRKRYQALVMDAGRHFDKFNFEAPDGQHEIWFDISNFFGK